MKTFRCGLCGQVLYFESTQCVGCGSASCFLPDQQVLSAVNRLPAAEGAQPLLEPQGEPRRLHARYRYCRNHVESNSCNWGVPVALEATEEPSELEYCEACQLNLIVPDLSQEPNLELWKQLEVAKRRLLYTLGQLRLSYSSRKQDPASGLAFKFLADDYEAGERVLTGHAEGIITINIAEADPAWRERTRVRLGEAYRTILGHFRHEIGHYYWDHLIKGSSGLAAFRELFGDERADYSAALEAHYGGQSMPQRQPGFISAYASMHPWEDWAETWAHYLHMVDTLHTANEYGLAIENGIASAHLSGSFDFSSFDDMLTRWLPVTLALNSLNRSMGQPDPYPFTVDDRTIEKLRFVHDVVLEAAATTQSERPRILRLAPLSEASRARVAACQ